jgi:hypothetical protein
VALLLGVRVRERVGVSEGLVVTLVLVDLENDRVKECETDEDKVTEFEDE